MYKRIKLGLLLAVISLVSFPSFSDDTQKGVIVVENLPVVANLATERELPIMMFFAAEDCEFCEALEAEYLAAMAFSSEYQRKVVIRKFMIDGYDDVYGFDGERISVEDFVAQFHVIVTPTILMVDNEGNILTKKIIGYNRSGFFGAYLDDAIDEANRKVKTKKVSVVRQY